MTEMEEQVEYIVPNTVYEQLVTMALREIPGVAGTRGRGIVGRRRSLGSRSPYCRLFW